LDPTIFHADLRVHVPIDVNSYVVHVVICIQLIVTASAKPSQCVTSRITQTGHLFVVGAVRAVKTGQ